MKMAQKVLVVGKLNMGQGCRRRSRDATMMCFRRVQDHS